MKLINKDIYNYEEEKSEILKDFDLSQKLEITEKALEMKERYSKNRLVHKKDTKDETVESRVFEYLKPLVFIESMNKNFYVFDKELCYFKYIDSDKLVEMSSDAIEFLQLFKYQKQSVYESCAKTVTTDLLKNNKEFINLNRSCITSHIEDNEYYNKTVHLTFEEDINDPNGVCIRIRPARKENFSCIYSPVKIPLSLITDKKGNKFDGKFENGIQYKYKPEMIKNGMYSKFIKGPWEDEEHFRAAQMLEGGWLTGLPTNISPVIFSEGGTGKSEQQSTKAATFPNMYYDYDASSDDQFNTDGIQGYPCLVIDESGESMNERMNKKLSGNSKITIKRKFMKGQANFDTKWTYQIFYINRVWKSKDQGDSMERRYFYLHQNKKPSKDTLIEGISDIIINGKKIRKDGKWITYESDLYSCFAYMMEGALKVFDLGRFPRPTDFGESVVNYNRKMFAVMINIKSFFSEFKFAYASKKKFGITHTDLYRIYRKYLEDAGATPQSREKFLQAFESEFNKNNPEPLQKTRLKKGWGYPLLVKSDEYGDILKQMITSEFNEKEETFDDIELEYGLSEFEESLKKFENRK